MLDIDPDRSLSSVSVVCRICNQDAKQGSAGNRAVDAGGSIRPQINRASSGSLIYLCIAAVRNYIRVCELYNDMDIAYIVYSENILISKINSKDHILNNITNWV